MVRFTIPLFYIGLLVFLAYFLGIWYLAIVQYGGHRFRHHTQIVFNQQVTSESQ